MTEPRERLVTDPRGGAAVGEIDRERLGTHPSRGLDLVLQDLQEISPPRDHQSQHALGGEDAGDLPPDPHAASSHHGGAAAKLEIHPSLLETRRGWATERRPEAVAPSWVLVNVT